MPDTPPIGMYQYKGTVVLVQEVDLMASSDKEAERLIAEMVERSTVQPDWQLHDLKLRRTKIQIS